MKRKKILLVYLLFSSLAIVLLILMAGANPTQTTPGFTTEKLGIAGLFILCCGAGISFTVKPNWVHRFILKSKDEQKKTGGPVERSFRGHHPVCQIFQKHTILWRRKTWCAGCLGLFFGLSASSILMVLFIMIDLQLTKTIWYLLLIIGVFIIAVVYTETLHRSKYPTIHVVINSLLPCSFFIITFAVRGITGSFIYSLFTILLCFLWLDTRIQLSKWHHNLLCTRCSESCKMFTDPS